MAGEVKWSRGGVITDDGHLEGRDRIQGRSRAAWNGERRCGDEKGIPIQLFARLAQFLEITAIENMDAHRMQCQKVNGMGNSRDARRDHVTRSVATEHGDVA